MSFLNSFKSWVTGEAEDEEEYYVQEDEAAEQEPTYAPARSAYSESVPAARESMAVSRSSARNNKIVNINATTKLAVVLVRAEQFNGVSDIADHLKNKMTVVLNLENAEKDTANRMLDFLSGVTYAIEGKIKRVAKDTYLITPYNVEIVGEDLISELESNGLHFPY
ncbi:MAG: cell division protein SepF [Eubacteriales bacterium]|nr:cell division protein SepF [Eubacteriales bacterium]